MNSRGFTVIEMLVVLVITGVVLGLLTGVILETRSAAVYVEKQADSITEISRIFDVLDQWFSLAMADENNRFTIENTSFVTRDDGRQMTVSIQQKDGSFELVSESRIRILVKGQLEFEYLSENGWSPTWQDAGLPRAVSIKCNLNQDSGTDPYQLVINLLNARPATRVSREEIQSEE